MAAYWDRLQQRDAYLRGLRSQEAAALAQGVSTAAAPDTLPLAP
jgi:glutathione S-transferase